ncbi:MAG: hemerythrin family protein [Deltaproteobacteria bacterium]|nr:hemerythrin family protein [Deltaproteobacteria bacterium]
MEFTWNDNLSVGIEEIDQQHKNIYEVVNMFLKSASSGMGKIEIASTLDFLIKHIEDHFCAEEELMEQHSYPGLSDHKAEHDEFKETIFELKEMLDVVGPSLSMLSKLSRILRNWIPTHIEEIDKQFADFIHNKS